MPFPHKNFNLFIAILEVIARHGFYIVGCTVIIIVKCYVYGQWLVGQSKQINIKSSSSDSPVVVFVFVVVSCVCVAKHSLKVVLHG